MRLRRAFLSIVTYVFLFSVAGIGLLYAFQRDLIYPGEGRGEGIFQYPPQDMEVVTLDTEDGLAIRSFFRAPQGDADTIVYFHGNGGNALMAYNTLNAVAGTERGLMLVEYRGYASNPGSPNEQGLYADGRAALAFLADAGIAADRTVIGGFSLGTGVASQIAAEVQPKALFLLAPFTSLDKVAAENVRLPVLRPIVKDKFATDERLAEIDADLFIAHGEADTLVPPDHGRALAALRPDAETLWLPGARHSIPWDSRLQQSLSEWVETL